jgi:hypothetical protein
MENIIDFENKIVIITVNYQHNWSENYLIKMFMEVKSWLFEKHFIIVRLTKDDSNLTNKD